MFPDDIPSSKTSFHLDDDRLTLHTLPSALHKQLDILALQIQHNGGTGHITLSFVHGDVCVLNQGSVLRVDECGQLL